jgi:hypothetical protein
MVPKKGDVLKKHLLLANSHDGSLLFTAMFTATRVVCMNTLRQALAGTRRMKQEDAAAQGIVRIRHDGSAERRVEEAKKILGLSLTTFDDMEALFAAMAKKMLKPKEFVRLIDDIAPLPELNMDKAPPKDSPEATAFEKECEAVKKERAAILELAHSGRGQDGSESVWAAYSGATEFYQYHDWGVASAPVDKRLDRLWFGAVGERSDNAYRVCAGAVSK